ncbi:MAG: YchJ family protein [Nitrospirales bacterium]|nr:YchJ family protein [Nitrospira sp.]MDR4502913.1 YchJ family protein [Nitrospirales bacterium]
MLCPCQSGKPFNECCEPIIDGLKKAETAEQLMRARYSAYTQINMGFIEATHDPETKSGIDMKASQEWAESTKWTGLEILDTQDGQAHDETGTVLFTATYETDEGPQQHHELSQFTKRQGTWFFTDAVDPTVQPYRRTEPKLGRNDPCSCGSGKKYKKCCGV